jgi:hypothetical protein
MVSPLLQSQFLPTVEGRVKRALDAIQELGGETGDQVYLGIGMGFPWAANDTMIVPPQNTTDYANQVHRNLVAMKKLSISTASLVVRRHDWVANTFVYDPYQEQVDMFALNQTVNCNGTVSVTNSNILVGVNSSFTIDFSVGDIVQLNGDDVFSINQQLQVINIANANFMTLNSNTIGTFTNATLDNIINTAPNYALNFYVRNIYDQVFICLANNNGTISSSMPQISLGGQLPQDPFIITDDGYEWKYLYTMSSGSKKLFFTEDWMPVGLDNNVLGAAVNGRLDIINILDGGEGYNGNVVACSAPILVLVGDGIGANLTAQVDANGTITEVNILNGGQNYTTAQLFANTGANGAGAVFDVVIGPRGGYGSNVALELGATTLMVSTSLDDTEDGTIPVEDISGEFFTYRQLALILNPETTSGNVASNTNYDMTLAIQVSPLGNSIFNMGDIAYQNFANGVLQGATFSGTVVWYDASTQNLHLNNIAGTGVFTPNQPIKGVVRGAPANTAPHVTASAFTAVDSEIETFSGVDIYFENVAPIQRFPNQTEEIRLIISF